MEEVVSPSSPLLIKMTPTGGEECAGVLFKKRFPAAPNPVSCLCHLDVYRQGMGKM